MIGDLVTRDEMRAVDNRAKNGPLPGSGGTYDGSETMMRAMIESMVVDPSGVTDELVTMRTAAANRNQEYYDANMGRVLRPTDPDELLRLTTTGRLDRISIPGIAMFGDKDVLYAVEAAHLQEDALPKVQFFYPENTGHQARPTVPSCTTRSSSSSSATARSPGRPRRPPASRPAAPPVPIWSRCPPTPCPHADPDTSSPTLVPRSTPMTTYAEPPVTTTGLSLVERARQIAPIVAEYAVQNDQQRTVAPEAVQAMIDCA